MNKKKLQIRTNKNQKKKRKSTKDGLISNFEQIKYVNDKTKLLYSSFLYIYNLVHTQNFANNVIIIVLLLFYFIITTLLIPNVVVNKFVE